MSTAFEKNNFEWVPADERAVSDGRFKKSQLKAAPSKNRGLLTNLENSIKRGTFRL